MLIDTHAHLWWDSYKSDLDQVLARAREAGVEKIIVPGTDVESSRKAVELVKKYPGVIYASVGVHPEEVGKTDLSFMIQDLRKIVTEHKGGVVATGEIGTDASTEELKNCMSQQKELFREQCLLALEFELPVIIHTRNSLTEALEVLDSLPNMPRGQFHCFSHDEDGLRQVLKRGFYVSFCGNITWSKRVSKLVQLVPDDRLLLETDSPLMVPRDKKGIPCGGDERNESGNVAILAETVAELRGISTREIEDITTKNANTLYKL